MKDVNMSTPEPAPQANDNTPVWELVIKDMQERDQEGRRKYGVPLQANNGRDPLIDAYQEALDLSVYLRQAIEEKSASDDEVEQLRVQLAGCLTAAEGGLRNPPNPGDYGWSVAYQRVYDLRVSHDDLEAEVEQLASRREATRRYMEAHEYIGEEEDGMVWHIQHVCVLVWSGQADYPTEPIEKKAGEG